MPPVEATASSRPEGSRPDVSFALRLPRVPAATGDARHVIRRRLGEPLSEAALDDVLLVVSELVANAVLHGHGDIALQLLYDGGCVSGSVTDEGAGFDHGAREPAKAGGYGLEIVERVAARWGHDERSSRVWFEIAVREGR